MILLNHIKYSLTPLPLHLFIYFSGLELRLGRAGDQEANDAVEAAKLKRLNCSGGSSRWQDSFLILLVTIVTVRLSVSLSVYRVYL